MKVPTTKSDSGKLAVTARVNWSDSECVSAVFLLLLKQHSSVHHAALEL